MMVILLLILFIIVGLVGGAVLLYALLPSFSPIEKANFPPPAPPDFKRHSAIPDSQNESDS